MGKNLKHVVQFSDTVASSLVQETLYTHDDDSDIMLDRMIVDMYYTHDDSDALVTGTARISRFTAGTDTLLTNFPIVAGNNNLGFVPDDHIIEIPWTAGKGSDIGSDNSQKLYYDLKSKRTLEKGDALVLQHKSGAAVGGKLYGIITSMFVIP